MALALLRSSRVPRGSDVVAFDIDVGSNRYYRYSVGDDSVDADRGFPMLGAPTFVSPLIGPLPADAMGRATLDVPAARFDRDHRTIQLMSFRTPALHGPAVSEPLRVGVISRSREDLPALAFSNAGGVRYPMDTSTLESNRAAPWRYAEPMAYREVRPVSKAMFLGQLLPMLTKIAGKVLPIVTAIAKVPAAAPAGGGSGATAPGAVPGTAQPGLSPDTIKLLMELLQQLKAPAAPESTAKSMSVDGYSHAAIAPALLAALPALMPLLEKVLTPETMKAILDTANPTKIIGAVTDSVKEIGKLGLDFDKQSNEHLRALNPMGIHAPVDDLLAGMGLATSLSHAVTREKGEPAYRRVESVTLSFAGASPVMIHGRSRVCYRKGDDIAFALDVKTPQTITDGTIEILVKDPSTRKVLARRSTVVSQLASGRVPKRIALSGDDIKALATGEEYLVCVYLTWKNAKGKVIGTSRTQQITLIGEYIFDRIEEGTVVPLNDVAKYRAFWHKVWQGSFTTDFFKADFEGKYYYVLEPARPTNAPIESTVALDTADGHAKRGRIRSGMTTSLGALNALIPQISTGKALSEVQLAALASSDFVSRFNSAARFSARLAGKAGVSAALWIYPEVKLHQLVLFKAASTDADSHVRELVEERLHFPIPVSVHVIGARSTQ
jgi:hypothetical protein